MRKLTSPKKQPTTCKTLKVIIATDGEEGFFARGKEIAKLADEGRSIPSKRIINFNSPEEMLTVLTKTRRGLMACLRKGEASITEIANLINRDRAAVAKDIKLLEHYGLVTVSKEINSGHGHRKLVHAISKQPIKLETFI
jgi:predicted transcriptional regulator